MRVPENVHLLDKRKDWKVHLAFSEICSKTIYVVIVFSTPSNTEPLQIRGKIIASYGPSSALLAALIIIESSAKVKMHDYS